MATRVQSISEDTPSAVLQWLARWFPLVRWLQGYDRQQFVGDVIAGVIVAVVLVPQSMAYALLAGLPPQVGLYASILPLVVYGLLGSSRVLAVGPVAMDSLLVLAGVSQFAAPGSAQYIELVLTLTLMIALIQMAMGALRVGFLVNFLSHPVLAGFTSAAALIIGFSQAKALLGTAMPRTESIPEILTYTVRHWTEINPYTLAIALSSLLILFGFKLWLKPLLTPLKLPEGVLSTLLRMAPLLVVVLGTLGVWGLGWHDVQGVAVVGQVPTGLPPMRLPHIDMGTLQMLFPTALAISLVGYIEGISIGKSLASKRREKVSPNQELIAIGAANMASALSGGYPITGGLSRSVVNYTAGARTSLASLLTAGLMLLTVLYLTPLFYYLPQAALAAIIIVAVTTLFDYKTLRETWQASRPDALAMLVTFFGVLGLGIQQGIFLGAVTAIFLHLWQTSTPKITRLGRRLGTEQYLDATRYNVEVQPDVLVVRVDESLYFPNAHHLEEYILNAVTHDQEIESVVLVFSAVNIIDASALHVLEGLLQSLCFADVRLYFSEVKPSVLARMERSGFVARLGERRIFNSTFEAYLHAKVPHSA